MEFQSPIWLCWQNKNASDKDERFSWYHLSLVIVISNKILLLPVPNYPLMAITGLPGEVYNRKSDDFLPAASILKEDRDGEISSTNAFWIVPPLYTNAAKSKLLLILIFRQSNRAVRPTDSTPSIRRSEQQPFGLCHGESRYTGSVRLLSRNPTDWDF